MKHKMKILIVAVIIAIVSFVSIQALMSMDVYEPDTSENETETMHQKEVSLGSFALKYLKTEYMPMFMIAEKGLYPEGRSENEEIYGYTWDISEVKFYVATKYNYYDSNIYRNIIEVYEYADDFDDDTALESIEKYFGISGDIECDVLHMNKCPYCEMDLSEEGTKVFVGAWYSNSSRKIIVFTCEIPEGSEVYSWNSCSADFRYKGV